MKSWKLVVAALALTVGFAGASVAVRAEAPAGGDKPKTDKPKNEKPKAPTVYGEISKIDGSSLTLAVKAKAKEGEKPTTEEKVITAADNVEVKIEGETKTLGDLKVGQKVKVTLDAEGGKAVKIEVPKPRSSGSTTKKKEGGA